MKYVSAGKVVGFMALALLIGFQPPAIAATVCTGSGSTPEGRVIGTRGNRAATGRNEVVTTIILTVPRGVQRLYGSTTNPDPGSVTKVLVRAPNVNVTLTITKAVAGSEGKAGFDADGAVTKTVQATPAGVSVDVLGLKESTQAEDMKITASATGQTSKEAKFIVFSKFDSGFASQTTQHKDTIAGCTSCWEQSLPPTPDSNFLHMEREKKMPPDFTHKPCDHVRYFGLCDHCAFYCLRCCAAVLYGPNQDYYKAAGFPTVQENHMRFAEDLTVIALIRATPAGNNTGPELVKVNPGTMTYANIYETLLAQRSFMGASGVHAGVVHGLRRNDADGTITPPNMRNWDPETATSGWRAYHEFIYPRK